jgi:two-component system, cell cycle sensor histidine kinase and response regulator CckA
MASDWREPQKEPLSGTQSERHGGSAQTFDQTPQPTVPLQSPKQATITKDIQLAKDLSKSPNFRDLFSLSKSGIVCFHFPEAISTDLPKEKILDRIWLTDSACIEANQALAERLGFAEPACLLGKSFGALFPANQKNFSIVKEWIENDFRLCRIESLEEGLSGQQLILQTSIYATVSKSRIQRVWIVTKDITQSEIAHLAREQENLHYRNLLDLPDLILLRQRPSGKLIYLSPQVKDIVGYSVEDFQANSRLAKQILHPDDIDKYIRLIQIRKNRSQETLECEYRVRHRDGTYHWLQERQVPKVNTEGQVEYYDSVIFDVQEKKSLKIALGQAHYLETVGTLAQGIAHDFNNYLAAILGQINLSLKELSPSHPCYRRLASAEQAALRCTEMTRHLLSFGRTSDLRLQPLDTNKLLRDTYELVKHLLPANLDIRLELAPRLSPVKGNYTQLQQVLMNLAVNSRDAMNQGGSLVLEAKNVALGDEPPSKIFPQAATGNYIEISVTDTGKGIPPACLPHIFDPFFTTKSENQGSGLGLSMTYSIIKSHEGFIHISSEEDKGTSAVILLPSADLPLANINTKDIVTSPRGEETVLVAEDDEMVLAMVESALSMHGYSVITAVDGQQAVDLFKKYAPAIDIALIDQTMPKLTGTEVLKVIYENTPKMRVILTSGYGEKVIKEKLNDKYSRFISKPYPVPTLLGLVRELLDID